MGRGDREGRGEGSGDREWGWIEGTSDKNCVL